MHYDGIGRPGERFEFFPLSQSKQATKERSIGIATYEILELTETRDFMDSIFDWSKAFAAVGTYHILPSASLSDNQKDDNCDADSDDTAELDRRLQILLSTGPMKKQQEDKEEGAKKEQKNTTKQEENIRQTKLRQQELWETLPVSHTMRDKLRNLAQEVKAASAKKQKKDETRKSSRIPPGFSLRTSVQKRGPKSMCQGCKQRIGYTEKCIIHSFMAKNNHKHLTIERFHCTAMCLEMMRKAHLEIFLDKAWTDKEVKEVKRQLEKKSH